MSHLLRARYMFPTSCLQGCPEVTLQSKLLYHTLTYNHWGKKYKMSTQDYIKDTMDTPQEPNRPQNYHHGTHQLQT
jgi:hypothetical protein